MDNGNARPWGLGQLERHQNFRTCHNITKDEIVEAWRKMGAGKILGPDCIPLEIWKCLHEEGLNWLARLFNAIFRATKMLEEWRINTTILVYENKDNVQS